MVKPGVAIFHGAWHCGAHFDKLRSALESHGYEVETPDAPSVGANPTHSNFDADVATVRASVEKFIKAGKDVVVVAHSFGGVLASQALEGLAKTASSQQGGVTNILYIAASLPRIGMSTQDATVEGLDSPPDLEGFVDMDMVRLFAGMRPVLKRSCQEAMTVMPKKPITTFYHDVEPTLAEHAASLLKPESLGVFMSPLTHAAYLEIPSTYLFCEDDQCVPLAKQQQMVQSCRDKVGASIKTETVNSSHSPFLSHTEYVEKLIRRLAGESGV